MFHKSFMEVSRIFFKVFNRSLKDVLFLKVYYGMSLIAATRAEGGLVLLFNEIGNEILAKY